MRTYLSLLLLTCTLPLAAEETASPFIVETSVDKHASKNNIKEEVGEHMKGTLHICAVLARELGYLQAELAQVQEQLFDKVEALIDNRKPFKKATRTQLQGTSNVLVHAEQELGQHLAKVKQLRAHLQDDHNLKAA